MKKLFHIIYFDSSFFSPSPPTSPPYLYPPNSMPSFFFSLKKKTNQIGKYKSQQTIMKKQKQSKGKNMRITHTHIHTLKPMKTQNWKP